MEEKQLELIKSRIQYAEADRDGKYGELWRDCERRYRSQPAGRREGSNLFVPHTFMQCEVIKARITESLFSTRPYLTVLPREGWDEEMAQKVETLLDWQMNERMDLPRVMGEKVASDLVVYGTAVVYTGWEYRTREIRRGMMAETPLLDEGGEPILDADGEMMTYRARQVEQHREVVADDPVVVCIPLQDFYVDPEAESLDGARYLGHKEYKSRAELEILCEQGKYQIDWDEVPETEEIENQEEGHLGLYLLHHYWEEGMHLVFLNRGPCILEEENPFWHGEIPYNKTCYVPINGEFYGMGIPEILAGLQDELNTSRNQRIDYNSLSLRRMWKLRKGCGLTARDLVWRQNGVLQVENMDDVQEINIQSLPADAFANESSVKQDMQDTTGCHDVIMGASYAQETATTTVTRDNNASLRFKTVMNALVKDILLPVARKFIALDKQFLSEGRVLRLLGEPAPELFTVEPEDISGEYDVIYCGTAVESQAGKEENKEKALQAYSLALADPAYQKDDAARLELFRRVLETLGMENAERLLPEQGQSVPDAQTAALTQQQTTGAEGPGLIG